ncbi:MAG: hypothetical protein ACFE9T_01800 [Promethearchaeota archaeon]
MKELICIHGIDEINCPTCRIIRSTLPKRLLDINKNRFLKIENPLFRKNYGNDQKILNDLFPKQINSNLNPIMQIARPNLINKIPDFKNKILLERLNELDLSKFDKFGIDKRIPLESPEWKFEKEE